MNVTHTHTGGKLATGYRHCGKHFNHYGPMKTGRSHALNADGRGGWVAVCGEYVSEYAWNSHDQDARNPVVKASEGRVTCKRCLARKPVVAAPVSRVEFRLMYDTSTETGRCWQSGRTRGEVEAYTAFLVEKRDAVRVWVDEVMVTTTY